MKTKNVTITVPVLSNPLPKLNALRKDVQRAYYCGLLSAQYQRGNTYGAFVTYHKIKSL